MYVYIKYILYIYIYVLHSNYYVQFILFQIYTRKFCPSKKYINILLQYVKLPIFNKIVLSPVKEIYFLRCTILIVAIHRYPNQLFPKNVICILCNFLRTSSTLSAYH